MIILVGENLEEGYAMGIVRGQDAPVFRGADRTFTVLAAPSLGAQETCVRRAQLLPGAQPRIHSVAREQIFVLITGRALAQLADETFELTAGDTLIVPARTLFSLANPYDDPCEAIALVAVGAELMIDGETQTPDWLQ